MSLGSLLAGLAIGLALVMTGAWVIVVRTGKSGWIDAIWSLAVGAAGIVAALIATGSGTPTTRQIVVAALAAIWSLRLGLHIAQRTVSGGGDDPRYAKLREEWGDAFPRRLLLFLQIQAACGFLLVLSILVAAHNPAPGLRVGDGLGALLLVAAIVGEGIADNQLVRFRADPANKGRVCDIGLWGVSRHPNYFFEWLGWLAYAVIAIDPTGGYVWGWIALAGPALMYWLLVYASGIPPLEAHMLRSRGDAFRAYQARVNAFWPGPPRARRRMARS
jgi:steroid 5-alpha reductase family enzyme